MRFPGQGGAPKTRRISKGDERKKLLMLQISEHKRKKTPVVLADAVSRCHTVLHAFRDELDMNPKNAWLTSIMKLDSDRLREVMNFTSHDFKPRIKKLAKDLFAECMEVSNVIDTAQETMDYAELLVQSGA